MCYYSCFTSWPFYPILQPHDPLAPGHVWGAVFHTGLDWRDVINDVAEDVLPKDVHVVKAAGDGKHQTKLEEKRKGQKKHFDRLKSKWSLNRFACFFSWISHVISGNQERKFVAAPVDFKWSGRSRSQIVSIVREFEKKSPWAHKSRPIDF